MRSQADTHKGPVTDPGQLHELLNYAEAVHWQRPQPVAVFLVTRLRSPVHARPQRDGSLGESCKQILS